MGEKIVGIEGPRKGRLVVVAQREVWARGDSHSRESEAKLRDITAKRNSTTQVKPVHCNTGPVRCKKLTWHGKIAQAGPQIFRCPGTNHL